MARLRFAPMKQVPPGLWRRVPPAIFPPLLGLCALALAWDVATGLLGLPVGPAGFLSGAVAAMAALAYLAYGVKLCRRPAVLVEELAILPGRAGVAAGVLSVYLAAAMLGLYSPMLGRLVLVIGLGLHGVLVVLLVRILRQSPPEQQRVNPVWHLSFTGFIVAARVALLLGWPGLATLLFWPMLAVGLAIYALSAQQFRAGPMPPPPLRPMLAIHLAPLALFGMVAEGLGFDALAWGFALLALAGVFVGVARARWLLAGGMSPFWGALTFPLAATASLWVTLLGAGGGTLVHGIAALLLVLATLVDLPIAYLIWRDWARGHLPVKTNAAIA